jgi:hypothetical protein
MSRMLGKSFIPVDPYIANALGINAAAFLAKLHGWIEHYRETNDDKDHYREGRWWVSNSYENWQEDLPWLSVGGVRKITTELRNRNIILVANFNHTGYDRTLWYTIDYEVLSALLDNRADVESKREKKK